MDGVTAAPPFPGAEGDGARRRAAAARESPLGRGGGRRQGPGGAAGGACEEPRPGGGRRWLPRGAARGLSPRSLGAAGPGRPCGGGDRLGTAGTARARRGRAARVVARLRPPASPPLTTSVTRVRAARRELGLRLREFLRTFLLNSDPRPPGAPACPGPAARPRRGRLASGRRCPGPAPPAPGGEAAPPAVRPPGGAGGTCPSGGLERRSPRAHPSHGACGGCSWSPRPEGPRAGAAPSWRPLQWAVLVRVSHLVQAGSAVCCHPALCVVRCVHMVNARGR